jgi:ADP-ribosylglycohydrolase
VEHDELDLEDFAEKLVRWSDEGYCAVDNLVFDIGITTSAAVHNLRHGKPAELAGPADQYSNGNGALMRVLPLALWHRGSDEELVEDAMRQSLVTHGHLRSQLCCALYCLWARRILEENARPWPDAVATLRTFIASDEAAQAELEFHIRPDDTVGGKGSGYVVDCLKSALWAVEQGDYEAAVKAAVALGNDTDTTACVAGGIAGLRDGVNAIPERWREALRGSEIVEPLLQRLITA